MLNDRTALLVAEYTVTNPGWTTVYTPALAPHHPPVTLKNKGGDVVEVYTSSTNAVIDLGAGDYITINPADTVKARATSGTAYVIVGVGVLMGSSAATVSGGGGEMPGYSSTEDGYQVYVLNQEHSWTQEATLADVTNGADGTYYYYIDFDRYRYGALQLALDCAAVTVTATLEASVQDDGTAQASCAYLDVTNDLFGVASLVAAAAAASDMWVIDTPFPAKFLRVKIVAATGANTGDWTIYWRGCY